MCHFAYNLGILKIECGVWIIVNIFWEIETGFQNCVLAVEKNCQLVGRLFAATIIQRKFEGNGKHRYGFSGFSYENQDAAGSISGNWRKKVQDTPKCNLLFYGEFCVLQVRVVLLSLFKILRPDCFKWHVCVLSCIQLFPKTSTVCSRIHVRASQNAIINSQCSWLSLFNDQKQSILACKDGSAPNLQNKYYSCKNPLHCLWHEAFLS